jgi:uncharacterized protein (TIGR02453 family)
MKSHPMDSMEFPPFRGFPKETLEFLRRLKKNNNREWFLKRKEEYEESVKFPMQCLIAGLAVRLAGEIPEIEFNPKRSIFRIYRDVRFSKNKAPFKTNIAAFFSVKGRKGVERPGLYLGVEPGEVFMGGGLYLPNGDQIKAIRKGIVEHPDEYLEIVSDRGFRKRFGGLMGERLSKAPLGYPKDHPMIEHLRQKQFFVGVEPKESACRSPKFEQTVARVFIETMPLIRWLVKVGV